jgi:hypothetical protein
VIKLLSIFAALLIFGMAYGAVRYFLIVLGEPEDYGDYGWDDADDKEEETRG